MPVEAMANGDVLFDLGMIYSTGRSGLIDLVAAHKWFTLAALKGRVGCHFAAAGSRRLDVGCRNRGRPARSTGLDGDALSRQVKSRGGLAEAVFLICVRGTDRQGS